MIGLNMRKSVEELYNKGLQKTQIAKELNISRSSVYNILNNSKQISTDKNVQNEHISTPLENVKKDTFVQNSTNQPKLNLEPKTLFIKEDKPLPPIYKPKSDNNQEEGVDWDDVVLCGLLLGGLLYLKNEYNKKNI